MQNQSRESCTIFVLHVVFKNIPGLEARASYLSALVWKNRIRTWRAHNVWIARPRARSWPLIPWNPFFSKCFFQSLIQQTPNALLIWKCLWLNSKSHVFFFERAFEMKDARALYIRLRLKFGSRASSCLWLVLRKTILILKKELWLVWNFSWGENQFSCARSFFFSPK